MTLSPTRASSERLRSVSSACCRWWLTQEFIAALKDSGDAFSGRLQTSLVTCPLTILNGSSLPTCRACAASM